MDIVFLVLVVALDVLHLYKTWPPPDSGETFLQALPLFLAPFALAAVLVFVGARPVMRAGDGRTLVLRGPVREHVLPLDAVSVDDTGKRLALLHGERRFIVWATERMNYQSSDALSAGAATVQSWQRDVSADGRSEVMAQSSLARPSVEDIILFGPWVAYLVAAAVGNALGWSPAGFA